MSDNHILRGRAFRIVVGIIVLALFLVGGVEAATLTVNASGGADYTGIQYAINNATAGDTILVYSGTYFENVIVNRQLILKGIDIASSMPVVDAHGAGNAITITADGVVLEGFNAHNSSSNTGIEVVSSNNVIRNNNASNNYYGLHLASSGNILINNTFIRSTSGGIYLSNSPDNKLINNTALFNGYGIYISYSSNNTITDNRVISNSNDGITLDNSGNSTVINNNVSYNAGNGIYLYSSGGNTLTDNNLISNNYGFSIGYSDSNIFMSNTAVSNTNGGIYLSSSHNNTVVHNMDNRNGWGIYLEYSSNNTISGNEAISNSNIGITLGNSGNNTVTDNNVSLNIGIGIYLYSAGKNTLTNNILISNDYGFSITNSDNNTLKGNVAISNTNGGIYLGTSGDNTLIENIENNNGWGIYLGNSGNNTITGNQALLNKNNGITLSASSDNTLTNNNASSNLNAGVYAWSSSRNTLKDNFVGSNTYGFSLDSSDNNTIINNNVTLNTAYGILLSSSSNNTLRCNNASNSLYGIYLGTSSFNTLSINNVSNNKWRGIELYSSSFNTLNGNNASNNGDGHGIILSYSRQNILSANNAFNNSFGISLENSNNNIVRDNNAFNNSEGFSLLLGSANTLNGNNVSDNRNYGIELAYSSNNTIYNNFFNNRNNSVIRDSINKWNITKTSGTNIKGGPYIGGNFWANPNGTGFSQTCRDIYIGAGICDSFYNLDSDNVDYLPLANYFALPIPEDLIRLTNTSSMLPDIAVSGSDVHVVWSDYRNDVWNNDVLHNKWEVYYKKSSDNGTTWNEDKRLTPDAGQYYSHTQGFIFPQPGIAADKNKIYIVWEDNRDGNFEIYYKYSIDDGDTWSNDIRLSNTPNLSIKPDIAVNGDDIHVVWMENYDKIDYIKSSDGGRTWSNVIGFGNTSLKSWSASIEVEGDLVHLIWRERDGSWVEGSGEKGEILYARSANNGNDWDTPVVLTTTYTDGWDTVWKPGLAVSANNVNLAWYNNSGYADHKPLSDIYYLKSPDSGQTWNNIVRLTYTNDSSRPTISAYNDSLHIAWREADHDALNYMISKDNGNTWSLNKTLSSSLHIFSTLAMAATDSFDHIVFYDTARDVGDFTWRDPYSIFYRNVAVDSFPTSITNLTNISYAQTYINWTWTDPADIDFDHVEVYIDNNFITNVSKGGQFFNASDFTSDTDHTISVRTVNTNGYISLIRINHTARTYISTIKTNTNSIRGGGSSGSSRGRGTSGENLLNIIVKEKHDMHIFKDRVTSYAFTDERSYILYVNITGNINAGKISTAVEVLRNISTLVKSPAPGIVYQNVNISVGTSGFAVQKNIKEGIIRFRVETSWLDKNNLASNEIKLVRWDGSKWIELETGEKIKDGLYTYFEAKTHSFSYFAITGMKSEEKAVAFQSTETPGPTVTSTSVQAKGNPGFEVIVAITALSAVYILRRINIK